MIHRGEVPRRDYRLPKEMPDTDYPLPRYPAWAKHLELALGPAAAHEEKLGDLLAAHPLG